MTCNASQPVQCVTACAVLHSMCSLSQHVQCITALTESDAGHSGDTEGVCHPLHVQIGRDKSNRSGTDADAVARNSLHKRRQRQGLLLPNYDAAGLWKRNCCRQACCMHGDPQGCHPLPGPSCQLSARRLPTCSAVSRSYHQHLGGDTS